MSSFREQEKGRELLEQWKKDVPFSKMHEDTGLKVSKIRSLIAEAAGGVNEWRKMREEKARERAGLAPIIIQAGEVNADTVRKLATEKAQETVEGIFDSDTLREMVQDEVKRFPPQSGKLEITLTTGSSKKVRTIDRSHSALKTMARRFKAGFINFFIVGPAGSGKSTLAQQFSVALNLAFGFMSMSAGATEGQLLGKMSSTGKYLPSLFVKLFENGGVFLLDECDAADPNMLLILNAALANGWLSVPNRVAKPIAKRHKDFILICAANTWGTGASFEYVGRNQLDAAFLSRFAGAVLEVTYDEALERSLTNEEWYVAFLHVRQRATQNRVLRILGTRELLAGQKLMGAGFTQRETFEALTVGWSSDEVRKAGILEGGQV